MITPSSYLFKAFFLLCLNILIVSLSPTLKEDQYVNSCDKLRIKKLRSNGNSNQCVEYLYALDGYDKDWTIMTDDYGKTHRVNLIEIYTPTNNNYTVGDWVKFYLYTINNMDAPEEIYQGNKSKIFMPDKPLKFLSHGWYGDKEALAVIRDAYLTCCDVNVVMVDWSVGAKVPYFLAAMWAIDAGIQVGQMADSMIDMYSFDPSTIDLIGFSLGAHVVGSAGKWLRRTSMSKKKIGRIFGLDPARPYFEFLPIFASLNEKDAKFVEVVHTNAGVNGVVEPHGHVDFYANGGGIIQPGCWNETYETSDCIDSFVCSHYRAKLFFAESLVTGGFTSTLCDNYHAYEEGQCVRHDKQKLGESCSILTRKNYYLDTNASPPFSQS